MALVTNLERQVITVTQDVDGYDNVIYSIDWMMKYTDPDLNRPDLEESSGGSTIVGHSAEELASFTPVADVTDEMIKGWVIDKMGDEAWTSLQNMMHERLIEKAANQPVLEIYYPAS